MLSIIRDFIMQFFNPLAFVGLVLFITLFLVKKKPKTAIWFLIAVLLIIGVFGNNYFSTWFTRSMEWRYMPQTNMEKADAILLLADGTQLADTPRQRVEVGEAADRALYAAMAYQQGLAPKVIVSGNGSRAESTKTLLMELGVPESDIILQRFAPNLREDIKLSLNLIEENEFKSVILVTSALRMDRTLYLLRSSDLEITPAPVDYQVTLNDWQNLTAFRWQDIITNLMPNSQAFQQSVSTLWEYVGLAFYRLIAIF